MVMFATAMETVTAVEIAMAVEISTVTAAATEL